MRDGAPPRRIDSQATLTPVQADLEKGKTSQAENASRYSESKENEDPKQTWVETSPDSPRNWPSWKKWRVIAGLQFYTVVIFIVSTGFVTDAAQDHYGVGEEVSILGQSMFILGVAIGPMFLAPLSEIYGRQPIYITGFFLFALLQIPVALSPTFAGVAVVRFITGCVAGIPISNVGASASDLFPTSQTAWPIMLFSFTSQALGPDLGPVIGSAFYVATGNIRWLYWLTLILGMIAFAWSLTFGETLHDKIYERKTGIKKEKSAAKAIGTELFRAFVFLFTEPVVTALALTTTYLFGLIFIYLEGYPLVYEKLYNFNATQEGAMFLPSILGGLLALVTQPLQNRLYTRSARSSPTGTPRPEARLYTACVAVWCLPASIFWFAFTCTHPATTSYQLPMWSGVLFGYAEVAVYTGIWQYVTDAYGNEAGSALAACNLPANGISAGLAHLAVPMFENLGTKWALGTLGFISLGFVVVPPLIVWKGHELRKRRKSGRNTAE